MSGDHFSGHAADYAKYRPGYPDTLFDWLASLTAEHQLAWDCGCGNGQAALPLAERYRQVCASDLSPQQIAAAPAHPGIRYRVAPAEESGLEPASVDLITVAQALHWFDFDRFYREVRRVAKPGAVIVAWTYQLLRAEPAIDAVLADFYRDTLGPYWPPERRWVDDGYRSLPFPFAEIPAPDFTIRLGWHLSDLIAYLGTWSATQRLRRAGGADPLPALAQRLAPLWGERRREIVWPIALRGGRVHG